MKANAGEVYTVYNQYLKRYTACQVAYIAPPDSVSKEPWAVPTIRLTRLCAAHTIMMRLSVKLDGLHRNTSSCVTC